MKIRDLVHKAERALTESLPQSAPELVHLATATITTSVLLALTKNQIESTFIGQSVGTFSENVTEALWHPVEHHPVSTQNPLDAECPIMAIAPVQIAGTSPGYFCFALKQDAAGGRVRPQLGRVFPPFFATEALALDYARSRHPLYIEPFAAQTESSLQRMAALMWYEQFDPHRAFTEPQTPWMVAPLYDDPPLYGAWRDVLTPRGSAIEVLTKNPENRQVFEPSLTHPPYVASDPSAIRRAIRSVQPAGAPIPDTIYCPRALDNQLTWEVSPHQPGHLIVRRTVLEPPAIETSPPVRRSYVQPLKTAHDALDKHPAWYVATTAQDRTLLWRPEGEGFVLGGLKRADRFQPYQFRSTDEALRFLAQRGEWGQVHPCLAITLGPPRPTPPPPTPHI